MASKTILLIALLTLTPRHLQLSDAPMNKIVFRPRRLKLFVDNHESHCKLSLTHFDVYKSIYCFNKMKKKEGLKRPSWVITTSKKPPRPVYSKNKKSVLYSTMNSWGSFYFL